MLSISRTARFRVIWRKTADNSWKCDNFAVRFAAAKSRATFVYTQAINIARSAVKLAFHDADTDTDTDILARIVARISACRSVCHGNNFRKSRVSDPREDVGVGVVECRL